MIQMLLPRNSKSFADKVPITRSLLRAAQPLWNTSRWSYFLLPTRYVLCVSCIKVMLLHQTQVTRIMKPAEKSPATPVFSKADTAVNSDASNDKLLHLSVPADTVVERSQAVLFQNGKWNSIIPAPRHFPDPPTSSSASKLWKLFHHEAHVSNTNNMHPTLWRVY